MPNFFFWVNIFMVGVKPRLASVLLLVSRTGDQGLFAEVVERVLPEAEPMCWLEDVPVVRVAEEPVLMESRFAANF